MSYPQQELWLLQQLDPHGPTWNTSLTLRLLGPLKADVLRRALDAIVERHDVLRTAFSVVDGVPLQAPGPARPAELCTVDLCGLPDEVKRRAARRVFVKEAARRFDLSSDVLLRTALLRLRPDEHVLISVVPHVVCDAWSRGVLAGEVCALYDAFAAGEPSPLDPLPIRYADFAVWQREWLAGETLERLLAFWRAQVRDGLPVLELPTDPAEAASDDGEEPVRVERLSGRLHAGLRDLAARERCTPFMVVLAALHVLLSRISGQVRTPIGCPVAGRTMPETEGLIGCFVNTLLLQTDAPAERPFLEVLRRTRTDFIEALDHQDLPFARLLEDIGPPRRIRGGSAFDVLINFVNVPFALPPVRSLTVEPWERLEWPAAPLELRVLPEPGAMVFRLEHRREHFSDQRAGAMLDQLVFLLSQMVSAPERPVGSYSLATPRAVGRLLPDPAAPITAPTFLRVGAEIASWARRTPDAPAVSHAGRTWTYADLRQSADEVTRALREAGLRAGEVVAVSGPRCFGLIAAAVGVLDSEGALFLVDPALGEEYQRVVLREADARWLVQVGAESGGVLLGHFAAAQGIMLHPETGRIVGRDAGVRPSSAASAEEPSGRVADDEPAYVFFTSGSTGKPKGVLGCHKGLSHFLAWQRREFDVGPGDRVAMLCALSFDAVLRDLLLPLTSGATLCLPPDRATGPGGAGRREPERPAGQAFFTWLAEERISILHIVPSLAAALLADMPDRAAAPLPSVRLTFSMGEALPGSLVRRWRQVVSPKARMINLYGPTETTLDKCFYEVPRGRVINFYGPTETTLVKCFYEVPGDEALLPGVQPLGRPMPDTQALVLNAEGLLCGVGEPGEIVLRTPFRALGYLNAPEETARRFVPNPFRADAEDILYRTGDRGRYRPDGRLEFLGRLDHQIKVRGVRVEPDAVAAILAEHPAVRACAVIGRTDAAGEAALAAYLVCGAERPAPAELRSWLSRRVPAAMVPTAFAFLEALPLLPNGKVDRRALPPVEAARTDRPPFAAPRDAVERSLAEWWQELLSVQLVGLDDSFLDLGGHSLAAMRLAARIGDRFGADVPLRRLLEPRTLGDLAAEIRRLAGGTPADSAAPVQGVGQGSP